MFRNVAVRTILVIAAALVAWRLQPAAAAPVELYIAVDGNDAWSGRLPAPTDGDGPFATLERARDEIRAVKARDGLLDGGITVYLRGGVYPREATFELTAEDGGAPNAPVVYRAYDDERPRLMGGRVVDGFRPVTDPAVRARFQEDARENVVELDLTALGIADYGALKRRAFGRNPMPAPLELFFDGIPMQLARWPNDDWTRIAAVPDGRHGGNFAYEGDRPAGWADADDIWLQGYWYWDWADSFERVAAIDREARIVTTAEPHGVYGYRERARFYFLNVLEELDAPGEFYVDRASGMLYFYPPGPLDGAETAVSLLETPLLTMSDVSHVTVRDLSFACTRAGAIDIGGGTHNRVAGCVFTGLGNYAVNIHSGTDHGVVGCDISYLGDHGVTVNGGDRMTLTPAGNFAENNHVHHYSRAVRTLTPAFNIGGVGNRIAHNLVHDAPHMGIGLSGNDHIIEFNEFHHILLETHDAGAFYHGRDWTWRGNVVRYNFFHHLGAGDVQAVYLDDWAGGTLVYGNICHGAGRGVLIGGGRDNIVENNIFVDCRVGVHIDQRGIGWAKSYFDCTDNTLFDRLAAVNGTQPPYTERYPALATLLDDEPALAKNNLVARNVFVGGRWLNLADGLTEETPYLRFVDNYIGEDPGFRDPAALDFRLKEDSPVFALGFQPIPVERIGLHEDEFRPRSRMPRSR